MQLSPQPCPQPPEQDPEQENEQSEYPHPPGVLAALANSGTLAKAIAPMIGSTPFAAFLKNSRRDCNPSLSFSFMMMPSRPIDSSDWADRLIKKRESLYLLLVPHLEALTLPILVERATFRGLTQICKNTQPNCSREQSSRCEKLHIHKASTVASFLTKIRNCQISRCQERALSKRFLIMSASRPSPCPASERYAFANL